MPLFGTLSTMPLPEVLSWLGNTARTGMLKVECDRVEKCLLIKAGRILGCTSNAPPERLGHFLLSRGRITEEELRNALNAQETTKKYLGEVFVGMGVLTEQELDDHLRGQIEETIYSMFDWDEAVFRFSEKLTANASAFQVDLEMREVVSRGSQRADEMRQIRQVFPDPAVIIRKTASRLPSEAMSNTMARTLYEAIRDDRSLEELLLHVHGSEYLVSKFLLALHRNGFIEVFHPAAPEEPEGEADDAFVVDRCLEAALDSIGGGDPPQPAAPQTAPSVTDTALSEAVAHIEAPQAPQTTAPAPTPAPAAVAAAAEQAAASEVSEANAIPQVAADTAPTTTEAPASNSPTPEAIATAVAESLADIDPEAPTAEDSSEPGGQTEDLDLSEIQFEPEEGSSDPELLDIPDVFAEPSDVEPLEKSSAYQVSRGLELAKAQSDAGGHEQALDTLEALFRKYPDEDGVRAAITQTETDFIARAYQHYVPASKVPTLAKSLDSLVAEKLSPTEYFLISRIDGTWDVKSIVQIAPIREVEVLITLKSLRERGLIEFSDAGSSD